MFKEFTSIGIGGAFCVYFLGRLYVECFNSFKTIGSDNILEYTNIYKICHIDIDHFCAGSSNLYFFIFVSVFLILAVYLLFKSIFHLNREALLYVQEKRENYRNTREIQGSLKASTLLYLFFGIFLLLLSVTVPFYAEGFSFESDPFLSLSKSLGEYWFILFAVLLSISAYFAFQFMISKRAKSLVLSSMDKNSQDSTNSAGNG